MTEEQAQRMLQLLGIIANTIITNSVTRKLIPEKAGITLFEIVEDLTKPSERSKQ